MATAEAPAAAFVVQMESVVSNEDGAEHQLWVRWSLNGAEQGRERVTDGTGRLRLCQVGESCPPPAGTPVVLSGFFAGLSTSYELVQRGNAVVIEDRSSDVAECIGDGCDEPEASTVLFGIAVPAQTQVELRASE